MSVATVSKPKKVRRKKTKKKEVLTFGEIDALCQELQIIKRQRDTFLKGRIGIENRLAASVASLIGYCSGEEEEERDKHWARCKSFVAKVAKGKTPNDNFDGIEVAINLVLGACGSIASFDDTATIFEKKMVGIVKQFPIYPWIEKIRGVGALGVGRVLGETGNLSNYANPAKVWKRMGCCPYEKKGVTKMPANWRASKPGLTAEDWTELGYCPRRRSEVFVLAVNITMQNKDRTDNVYYNRYLEARQTALEKHEDWKKIHNQRHGLLLCGKMFLRDMWVEWNK